MFQPRVKLEFVRARLSPRSGWSVYVDIDASEEGRTGGPRRTPEARQRQAAMTRDAALARKELERLGAQVGGSRDDWKCRVGLPDDAPWVPGDRDVIGYLISSNRILVAEVEGSSSGQPEQKLYHAVGQLVLAAGEQIPAGWSRELALVVDQQLESVARRAAAVACVGVTAYSVAEDGEITTLFEPS